MKCPIQAQGANRKLCAPLGCRLGTQPIAMPAIKHGRFERLKFKLVSSCAGAKHAMRVTDGSGIRDTSTAMTYARDLCEGSVVKRVALVWSVERQCCDAAINLDSDGGTSPVFVSHASIWYLVGSLLGAGTERAGISNNKEVDAGVHACTVRDVAGEQNVEAFRSDTGWSKILLLGKYSWRHAPGNHSAKP